MEPPTAETVSFQTGNSHTLLDRVTVFGLVEQQGRFLRYLSAADRIFLTASFHIVSDICGACM